MTSLNSRKEFLPILKKYTIWFVIYALFSVIVFFAAGHKSMFTMADGIYQQYAYYLYIGKWIRKLCSNIFIRHVFELPMWDMTIGMGSDSLITLSAVAYPLTDPFYWLSALIPYKVSEYFFDALIIFKLYLSGAAFAYFAYCRKAKANGIVAGALVYAFSSVIYVSFTQAYFINVFYLFPLLMIGVDRLWNNKGFKLYVLMLCACVMYSYYFTYMMGLLIVFYCVIRFIFDKEMHSVKSFLRLISRFIVYTVIGAGIGIGFQLPAVMNLSGLDRLTLKAEYALFSPEVFKNLTLFAFSNTGIGHEGFWGVSSVFLLAAFVLFADRKKDMFLKVLFVIYTVSFAIPAIGSVFNGLNFPTGRYIFGYLMLAAYIVTVKFDRILTIKTKTLLILTVISGVYCVLTVILTDESGFISGLSALIITGAMSFISMRSLSDNKKYNILMVLMLASCVFLGYAHFNLYLLSVEMEFGSCYDYLLNSNGVLLMTESEREDLKDSRFDYVPFVIDDVPLNSSMCLDVNGYDFYNSNYNNDVDKYYNKMAIISNPIGYMYDGLRGRGYLEMMNGTEYIVIDTANEGHLYAPYSYELVRNMDALDLYRTKDGTSMVYFYDEAVSESVLDSIDPISAEELMMERCILEDGPLLSQFENMHELCEYSVVESSGITETGENTYKVEADSYMVLSTEEISDSEIIVYLDKINADDFYVVTVSLGIDGSYFAHDFFEGKAINDMYYHWKDTCAFDFGYVEGKADTIRIYFNKPGTYSWEDIRIYTRSPEQIDETVSRFYEHADMDNISYELDGNHIHINATADQDKYLYIAVPYSAGWTAKIDGEAVPILKANIGFMAVAVDAGSHNVELTYRTPYLTEGLLITTGSLAVFLACVAVDKKRNNKNEKS